MNRNGIGSYVESGMAHRDAIPNLGRRARLVSSNAATESALQFFSDRPSPQSSQRFGASNPDQVKVEVTLEASPQVTFTLASHGNVKAVFRTTCSSGGVIHGSTRDVDYLLFLKYTVVN